MPEKKLGQNLPPPTTIRSIASASSRQSSSGNEFEKYDKKVMLDRGIVAARIKAFGKTAQSPREKQTPSFIVPSRSGDIKRDDKKFGPLATAEEEAVFKPRSELPREASPTIEKQNDVGLSASSRDRWMPPAIQEQPHLPQRSDVAAPQNGLADIIDGQPGAQAAKKFAENPHRAQTSISSQQRRRVSEEARRSRTSMIPPHSKAAVETGRIRSPNSSRHESDAPNQTRPQQTSPPRRPQEAVIAKNEEQSPTLPRQESVAAEEDRQGRPFNIRQEPTFNEDRRSRAQTFSRKESPFDEDGLSRASTFTREETTLVDGRRRSRVATMFQRELTDVSENDEPQTPLQAEQNTGDTDDSRKPPSPIPSQLEAPLPESQRSLTPSPSRPERAVSRTGQRSDIRVSRSRTLRLRRIEGAKANSSPESEAQGERADWRRAIRANASARVEASKSPFKSPQHSGHHHRDTSPDKFDHQRHDTLTVPEWPEKKPTLRPVSPKPTLRSISPSPRRDGNSIKSSVADNIEAMISSAISGRSDSGVGSPSPAPRYASSQYSTAEPPIRVRAKSSLSKAETKRLATPRHSLPPQHDVPQDYKLTSRQPVAQPQSRDYDGKLPSTLDGLDGYLRSLESSLEQSPTHVSPTRKAYFPLPVQSASNSPGEHDSPFKTPAPPRYDMFLRERNDFPPPPNTPYTPHASKTPSPKRPGSISPSKIPISMHSHRPSTPHASCDPSSKRNSNANDKWRWWKLVHDAYDDRTMRIPHDTRSETASVQRPNTPITPRNDQGARRKSRDLGITRPSHTPVHRCPTGAGSRAERRQSDDEGLRFDGLSEDGSETDERGSRFAVVEGGRSSGMQVIVKLDEDDSGRVWVEVTPSPKGRGRGRVSAKSSPRRERSWGRSG